MPSYDSTLEAVRHSSYDILSYAILFCLSETPFQNGFQKKPQVKVKSRSELCQFLYFISDDIFDKLSELLQIS